MPARPITTVHLTSHFKKSFKRLPRHIQEKAVEKDALFRTDCFDPRLDAHKLGRELSGYWSYSVDYHYRVKFRFVNDREVIYFNIGTHAIYQR